MENLNVTISKGNSKMGLIYSVSVPPVITCRKDAPCQKGCYALKGSFLFPNVINSYKHNLELFLEHPMDFELSILKQLPMYGVFRWQVAGDIVNLEYFEMMIRIAKKLKNVKFLAFTKKYELVNDYIANGGKIPNNLKIVYSAWNGLEVINPTKFPVAYVRDEKNLDPNIPKTALPCSGDCSQCLVCWGLRKRQSVVFHKH